MYLSLILWAILFTSVAMLIREGVWSNLITLINVICAGLIASSLFEPLADKFESSMPSFTYLADFLTIWGLFVVSFIVLRVVTEQLSKARVRFRMPVEWAAGGVLALWIGWVLVCFTCMTLHTAPLALHSFGGAFQSEADVDESAMFMGLAPDRQWLGLMHKLSQGSLQASAAEDEGVDGVNVFDPQGEFIYRYGQRRRNLERYMVESGAFRVRK